MSSGYGLGGGVNRCFPFWQEVLACYVINVDNENHTGKERCSPILEDYYECLHGRKEWARAEAMRHAIVKRELKGDKQYVPSREHIEPLGLIKKN